MARRQRGRGDRLSSYLCEIGRHPLLSASEEQELGPAIQAGRAAAEELASGATFVERRRQLEMVVRRGEQASQQLVESNLRLVVSLARWYSHAGLGLFDLIQEGNIGLLRAVERWDHRRGFRFSTYGTWCIRQAMARAIANTARSVRLPAGVHDAMARVRKAKAEIEMANGRPPTTEELAEELRLPAEEVRRLLAYAADVLCISEPVDDDDRTTLEDFIADETIAPADAAIRNLLPTAVEQLLTDVLDERQREVLRLRYGLGGGEPQSVRDVAACLGLIAERVRQLEARALTRLRSLAAMRELA